MAGNKKNRLTKQRDLPLAGYFLPPAVLWSLTHFLSFSLGIISNILYHHAYRCGPVLFNFFNVFIRYNRSQPQNMIQHVDPSLYLSLSFSLPPVLSNDDERHEFLVFGQEIFLGLLHEFSSFLGAREYAPGSWVPWRFFLSPYIFWWCILVGPAIRPSVGFFSCHVLSNIFDPALPSCICLLQVKNRRRWRGRWAGDEKERRLQSQGREHEEWWTWDAALFTQTSKRWSWLLLYHRNEGSDDHPPHHLYLLSHPPSADGMQLIMMIFHAIK